MHRRNKNKADANHEGQGSRHHKLYEGVHWEKLGVYDFVACLDYPQYCGDKQQNVKADYKLFENLLPYQVSEYVVHDEYQVHREEQANENVYDL